MVAWKNLMWRNYNNGQREDIYAVPGRLYVQTKLLCSDNIESQYHNHLDGKKSKNRGDRLVTEDVCAICYSFEDKLLGDNIEKNCDIGGNNPLFICCDALIAILKFQPQVDLVTQEKISSKRGHQRLEILIQLYKTTILLLKSNQSNRAVLFINQFASSC